VDTEGKDERERTAQVIGQVAAAMAGERLGGPGGAVTAGLGSVYFPYLARKVWEEFRPDQQRRAAEMFDTAAKASGWNLDELDGRIRATERTRLLSATAMDAAARTTWPPKVRALGRALADGLIQRDDAQVDIPQFALSAMTDIESPHLSLLELLRGPKPGGFTIKDIGHMRPHLRPVCQGLLGTLQRHGLAVQNDNLGKTIENYTKIYDKRIEGWLNQVARKARSHMSGFPPWPKFSAGAVTPEISWSATELGGRVLGYYREAGAEIEAGPGHEIENGQESQRREV